MARFEHLPNEVLVKIFSYYLETETQNQLVSLVGKTCQTFNSAIYNSILWHSIDGTVAFPTLMKLAEANCFLFTTSLKLPSLTVKRYPKEMRNFYSKLPKLRTINFTNVGELFEKKNLFQDLETPCCPELSEIILNENLTKHISVSYKHIGSMLADKGESLVYLDLSNVGLSSKEVVQSIGKYCPNLEHLYMHNFKSSFNIDCVQLGCPKLKSLRLGYPTKFVNKRLQTGGFEDLETFTFPQTENVEFIDSYFEKLLFASTRLKVIDIRGCKSISAAALLRLPATHIEGLYVSKTRLYCQMEFINVLEKWQHSLKTLDLSRMPGRHIDHVIHHYLTKCVDPQLEYLDINNTVVTVCTVKMIIERCRKLSFLQLESCRSLCRGLKRAYTNRGEIERLMSVLEKAAVIEID